MARIGKSQLTRLEIIQVATRMFLELGYTNTTIKAIGDELEMSKGNLTFHYPTKEHLLVVLVEMLCDFQWKLMEDEAGEGISSVMAICLELMSMASACEESGVAKDFFISAYQSPMSLDIIRSNDKERAKKFFRNTVRAGAMISLRRLKFLFRESNTQRLWHLAMTFRLI